MLLQCGEQERLELQHFRDIAPVEHTAHQHQKRERVRLQSIGGTFVESGRHLRRGQRREQDARILLHHAQQRVVVPAAPVGRHGVKILPSPLVPCAVALPAAPLRLRVQRPEGALRTFLHHVVEAVGHAVRQTLDKGVLRGQHGEQLLRVGVPGDKARHFRGKFVGKTHHREKFLLPLRQRLDHGGGEHGENIGITFGQRPMLRERPQVQVDGGEPALAGVEQRFRLRVGKLRAAAVRVNGQLRMVQPQLLCAEPVDPRPQPDDLCGGQKAVAAGDDQVDVGGQAARKHTEKGGHALVCEQVKIVDEQIAGRFPRQLMAEIVRQQPAAGGVRGTGILPQQVDARAGKGVLRAPPEDRKIVGIHADADDAQRPGLCALLQIPVHRGGLSVAHRGDHGGQRAAGDRPQALLQPLGYVDGVQLPLWLWHGASSVRRCALTIFYTKTGPLASGKRKEECAASLFSSLLFYALMASS